MNVGYVTRLISAIAEKRLFQSRKWLFILLHVFFFYTLFAIFSLSIEILSISMLHVMYCKTP